MLPRRMRAWVIGGTITYAAVVISFVVSNRFTTAANAILLQYTAPLWIAFMGWVFIRERPSPRELLAMAIGGAGVLLCASEGITLFARDRLVSQTLIGDAIALFSGFSFALLTVILRIMGRDAVRPPKNEARAEADGSRTEGQPTSADSSAIPPALVCLFYGNVLAALIGLPWLLADLSEPGMIGRPLVLGWGVLLWLGAGQLGFGYWLFQHGLRTTRALTASLLGLIEPVLNPVWVAFLVGELPSKGTQLGGILVLISVVLSLTARRSRRT
jgi:drug/metabolite transporter (DMT)-like permease